MIKPVYGSMYPSLEVLQERQTDSRRMFGLLHIPPDDPDGVRCALCCNECRIVEGKRGFCGLPLRRDC